MNTRTKKFLGIYLPIILIVVTIFVTSFFFQKVGKVEAGWYSTGGTWTYRKQITVDHSKVGIGTTTPLANFPMLFSVTDTDLKFTGSGGKVASSTGLDILFTSSDGTTKLDYEMESYSSTTGQIIAWVEIPALSPSADTIIYVYFGNASASDQSNMTGVWDSNYKGVYHLPNGTTLSATDSTSNVNNGTISGATTGTGKMDGGASFDGVNDYILGANTVNTGVSTVSAWMKMNVAPTFASAIVAGFAQGDGSGTTDKDIIINSASQARFYVYDGAGRETGATSAMSTGVWYYLVGTQDGTTAYIYRNGAQEGSIAAGSSYTGYSGANNLIGGHTSGYTYLNAYIDEVRFSSVARTADWIATEYNNQSSPSTFYAYGATGIASRPATTASVATINQTSTAPGWYSTGGPWTYRKKITIDHARVSTTTSLTDFPMLFSVTDADMKYTGSGGKIASSTGGDILFTSSDGTTKLAHEVEKYTSTTGETVIWVKIPTLSGVTDTVIYMYFGNSGATNQQDPTNVWDTNYKGVYHLKDGTTLNYNDSTSNAKNGSGGGGSANPTAATGKVDGAATFNNASYQYISLPSSTFGSGSVTVELWSKFTTLTGYWPMFSAYTSDSDSMEVFIDNTTRLFGGNYNNRALTGGTLVTGQWYHIVLTAVSGGVTQFYIDGEPSGTTGTTNFSTYTVASNIGRRGSYYYNNIIDEVRLSSGIARSPYWIRTTYNNQSSPNTFYAYGALESQSRVNSSGSATPTVKTRGGVKFR